MIKILMFGPSINKSKGGISTVISSLLKLDKPNYIIYHITTHIEGKFIFKFAIFLKAFLQTVLRNDFKIYHIHVASRASFFRKSIFALLGFLTKKKVILHVHSGYFDSFYLNASPLIKKYIGYIFNKSDKVILLSKYWFDFFNTNISKTNTLVLHNGVVPLKDLAIPNKSNSNKFLFLGKLIKQKGVYDLLESIYILVHDHKCKDLIFYIAGDGELDLVQKYVTKYHLSNNVKILGWVNETNRLKLFSEVGTMILPSYIEGSPMSILEAMAAGKIIISTKVGGIPDIVKDDENGYLIEPGNIADLVKSIEKCVLALNYNEISINNQKKINKKYSLNSLNIQLLKLYDDLANG